jgi:hypothetical protein
MGRPLGGFSPGSGLSSSLTAIVEAVSGYVRSGPGPHGPQKSLYQPLFRNNVTLQPYQGQL